MKQSERDDLIKLIDERAGPVPSKISDALAIIEPFVVGNSKVYAAWKTIRDANLQLGTSPGQETSNPGLLLQLRQKVLAFTVDPEETAPPPPPSPGPQPVEVGPGNIIKGGLTPNTGRHGLVLQPGASYAVQLNGAASNTSLEAPSGVVEGCISDTPHDWSPGAQWGTDTVMVQSVAAGKWFNFRLGASRTAPAAGTISAQKYGA